MTIWKRCWGWILVVLLAIGFGTQGEAAQAQSSGVSDARFARLARGINLTGWFWYAPDDIDGRFSDADFALIRDLGFTFVRVPIDLGFVYNQGSGSLNAENVAHIDRGLERLLSYDLAVVVDLHSTSLDDSNAGNYSGGLEDPLFVETFIEFWRLFAAHLQQFDAERIFIQPMNEPVFDDQPSDWLPIQERLVMAIREAAPENTILATGALWSGIDTLVEMKPLDDPNVVYDFHFYDPFPFTHQGATWTLEWAKVLQNVPYPSTPENIQPLVDTQMDDEARGVLEGYGMERWNAERIRQRMERVFNWAQTYGVRVICTEFGVLQDVAPPADRVRWIGDVRTLLESYGFGWAMWEFDGSFGLVWRKENNVELNRAVAQALGLNAVSP